MTPLVTPVVVVDDVIIIRPPPSRLSPLPGSRFNLAHLSRTICSCFHHTLVEIVCQLFPCNTRAFSHTHEVSLTRQPCGSIEEVDRYNVLKMFLPFARIQIVGIFHKSTFSDVSRRSVRMVG